jgi:hypothetical protein
MIPAGSINPTLTVGLFVCVCVCVCVYDIRKEDPNKKNSNAKCQKNMEAEDEKNRLHVVVGCEDMQSSLV